MLYQKLNSTRLRNGFIRTLTNIPGWRTNRKIVVIESDDWGTIRMPSKEVYKNLLNKGIRVDRLSFNRYDSLASEDDLTALFEALTKFRDKNGNYPVFTANCIVANPDFEKIRGSEFNEYHYEVFTETLKRYPKHENSFKLWLDGLNTGIFFPQFHGREHLNVSRWMNALKENIGNTRIAFDYGMYDLSESGSIINENSFMDSLSYNNRDELRIIEDSLFIGARIFKEVFNYTSKSFVAPCYIWNSEIEKILMKCSINFIQGGLFQKIPIPGTLNHYKRKVHFVGQRNSNNQIFLVRNVYFDPSENTSVDLVNDCIKRISTAFLWHKPAIISTHRMNYIGYIVPENRSRSLFLLKELLHNIVTKFPDVEFMTSEQLGMLIQES